MPPAGILSARAFRTALRAERWLAVIAWLLFLPAAWTAEPQKLHGHVPAATARLVPAGRVDGARQLNLAIGLPLRNQDALKRFVQDLQDPTSPSYHKYLTPAQFAEQFGPTEADYQAVIQFAKAHGLAVTTTHPNRVILDVAGAAADIEKALHVNLQIYNHPTEARQFFAPDGEPSLDLAVPIAHISGLDNYSLPKPRFKPNPTGQGANAMPNVGSGPSGAYMGNDFRTAYVPGSSLTGVGQTVGLLQFDGYTASDITYYENLAGLPNVTLTNVLLDNFSGTPTGSGGEVEVSLDIEMVMSMAPGVSKIIVYEAGPSGLWHDILNRMATDNLARQLSCSWYIPNGAADSVADGIFQQMAAQGQSFYSASGDSDAFSGLIPFPGDTPYITEVGGTTLSTSTAGGPWSSETAWNRSNGVGTGGGVSTQYSIPAWQQGINMTANLGSTSMRNVPDVALTAENVYVRADGADHNVGGTSCAAPLWAGFTALVNQQALAGGQQPVGFINPAVYTIGKNANYTTDFHDTATGNNYNTGSPAKFPAVSGYDLCTGWGTPKGAALINALAGPPDPLQVPYATFLASGPGGGPFAPSSQTYTLINTGSTSMNWTASKTQSWTTLSATSGTLGPGGLTTVTWSINAAANALAAGNYSDMISFTNTATGVSQVFGMSLTISRPQAVYFNLDTDPGWARQGEWAYGTPTGGGGSSFGNHDPTSGVTGSNVFGINLNGDYSTTIGGPYYLTTNAIDLSNYTGTQLRFKRWLNTDYPPYATANIQVSNDGTNWTTVFTNVSGSFITDSSWTTVQYDISAVADKHSTAYLRWGHQIGSSGVYAASGWNIDDVEILGTPVQTLALSLASNSVTEGSPPVTATLTINPAPPVNTVVNLASADTNSATVPLNVTILAGQSSANFPVTIIDDALLDGSRNVLLTATTAGYANGTTTLVVNDNETAALSVSAPSPVSEAIGTIQGTLGISAPPAVDVAVSMSSSDTTALQVPPTITIPAGQTSVSFPIAIIDDHMITGDRQATITAHVTNWTDGAATVLVQEAENSNLAMSLPATLIEGVAATGTVSISGTLTQALSVTLVSDTPSRLPVSSPVTIPAGATSATFTLNAPIAEGNATVTITASATGFTSANGTVNVLGLPNVTTVAAAAVTATSATLMGSVNPNSTSTSTGVTFDYGLTTSYGTTVAGTPSPITGASAISVSAGLSGLAPAATYHFRVNGANMYGTTNGGDLTFTTLHNNANLSNWVLSSGSLVPIFSSATTSYTASVANGTASITVTPTVADSTATVKVNGVAVASGTASGAIILAVGANTITVIVTAQDGTAKTYTAVVTRSAAGSFANTGSFSGARSSQGAVLLANGKVLVAGGVNGSALATAESYDPATGTWTTTGSLITARYQATLTLLPNGKALIVGGLGTGGALSSAELYDPSTGTWTATGSLHAAHRLHMAVLLGNGKVLIAGGFNTSVLNSAELYDPSTGTWTIINSMNAARYYSAAALLPSGKVLVAGGQSTTGAALSSSELYDPVAGTWTNTTGAMTTARYYHTLTALPNGKVLAAGGYNGTTVFTNAEIFDPSAGTWTATGSMANARDFHAASLLPNGKVLVTGGVGLTAELYDYTAGTWTTTGSLTTAHSQHTATIMANGRVLIAGGAGTVTELYDFSSGSWTNTGFMANARYSETLKLLPNGKVLAAGGYNGTWLASSELYDPVASTWTNTGNLNAARTAANSVLLSNGAVLVTGGYNGSAYLTASEIYNPSIGTWTATGSLNNGRTLPVATLLSNGKALVTGGYNGSSYLTSVELYDPTSGTWTATGSLNTAREYHAATLLASGKVLVTGGYNGSYLNSPELYDPSSGTWTAIGGMLNTRYRHTATLLPNGKVLVAGGYSGSSYLAAAELYDPASGTWTATGSMTTARYAHTATLLPNGKVLVMGGYGGSYLAAAELYDPATGTWTATGGLGISRYATPATPLLNGKVLIAGGYNGTYTTDSELYDPGLGFSAAWQPQVTSATTPLAPNTNLVVTGAGFNGISGASSGNYQDSAANYPVVQLLALESGQTAFLLSNSFASWSATSFTSAAVNGLPSGYALATEFTNGIPSNSVLVDIMTSNNANLSNLALSAGSLTPTFSSGTTSYTANVSYATTSITVTPTVAGVGATVKVNGVTVASGSASSPTSLAVGANTITTVVTAQDGTTTMIYSVVVTRAAASGNANLSNLVLSAGSLTPTFAGGTTSYSSSVLNTITSTTVTPTVADGTATVTVNGVAVISGTGSGAINLNLGSNTINTIVTAQDGVTTKTYSIVVTRVPSTNANLSNLVFSAGTLTPSFSSNTTSYTSTVPFSTSSATVTPTLTDTTATVTVNGAVVASGSASGPISLAFGTNTITIVVTAQDGLTQKIYTVVGTRPAAGVFANTGSLNGARNSHSAVLLGNGKVLVAGGLNGGALAAAELYDPATGTWGITGSLAKARYQATATLLTNGKALVVGGLGASGNALSSAELYDPTTGAWTSTGSLNIARQLHTAVLLPSGKLLVAGGTGTAALSSAEVFDPATRTWTLLNPMNNPRSSFGAVLLPNGKVLVVGGQGTAGALNSSEIYDPAGGTWTNTSGAMNVARYYHTLTLLPNGKVLSTGGFNGVSLLASAEIFDPAAGTWAATGSMGTARDFHSASLLPNGKVLAAGGGTTAAEVYDYSTGAWLATNSLGTTHSQHTATILASGKVLIAGGAGAVVETFDASIGAWSATGALAAARASHVLKLLPNGKVLTASGYNGTNWLASSELFDPASGTWTSTGSLNAARAGAASVLLANGAVLATGGYNGNSYLTSSELYNPTGGTWMQIADLHTARTAAVGVLLGNGNVLVMGGNNSSGNLAGSELYNSANGTWTATGGLFTARTQHAATLLANGKVLAMGGVGASGYLSSAELYDPSIGIWLPTGSLATTREYHTATLLPNGKVLVAGGLNGGYLASAELYDPAAGTWKTTGSLALARYGHNATLLPNGKVLVTGGIGSAGYLNSAELYDPASGTWTTTGALSSTRFSALSTLLPNGKVLIVGGKNASYLTGTELYDRGLGFTANWQPQITAAPSSIAPGGSLILGGSGFKGLGAGSSGNSQDSPGNYPLVQLRALESSQTAFVLPNSAASWSDASFASSTINSFPYGYALATVFTNGIPSSAVVVNFAPSGNANLSNLVLSNGTLNPAFASGTTSYTANVSPITSAIIVTPTAADGNATVTVNGAIVASGTPSLPIILSLGNNTINTVVTAQNGSTTLTYSTMVTRMTLLQNWRLTYFGTTANAGSTADIADYDNNGIPNLMKYAFGLDPTLPASRQLPQPVLNGNTLTISFTEPPGISGVTYGADWCAGLNGAAWGPVPDTGLGTTHIFSISIGNYPSLFMRLKVTGQ